MKTHDVSLDKIHEKLESENIKRVIVAAVEEIFWGASAAKVNRFAAVVANVIEVDKSDQELEDVIAFILALDELTEDDMKVLKHLYCHQSHLVSERHAMTYNSFFQDNAMVNMLMDARELGLQMDDFFSRCSRLTGYGLALELNTKHGSMGNPDDFAFRLTLLGKRLVEMLRSGGENVQVTKRQPR